MGEVVEVRRKDRGMSKYIKLEDAISKIVNTPTRVITDDLTALADRQHEIIDMFSNLPTIEVSEDAISREYILGEAFASDEYNRETKSFDLPVVSVRDIEDAPSVVPTVRKNRQVERAEGEWIYTSDRSGYIGNPVEQCSICGVEYEQAPFNYCPNCGSKMRGEHDD